MTYRNANSRRTRSYRRSGQAFFPQQLGHAALYDANNGGSTTQITDSGGNGLNALAFAASTAAPTYLGYDGTPYVWFPGVNGRTITCPDGNHLDITDDLEIVANVSAADWSPAALSKILAKTVSAGSRTYSLALNTTGGLRMFLSDDLTNEVNFAGSALTVSDGALLWVKATRRKSDGRVQYFQAADAASEPASFTQVGSDGTLLAATSIATSTTVLTLGGLGNNTLPWSGQMRRAILRNGIGGTTVADFDASLCGQSGYTDAQGNAWTVNYGTSGMNIVVKSQVANDTASGVITDGSNDYATGPTAAIPALTAADACTLYTVTRPRATMTTNMTFFSTRSGTGAGVTLRMASATTVVADISDGTSTVTTPAVTITPGTRYVLGVVIPTSGGAYCFANNTLGSTQARTGNTETGGALTVFANSTPTDYCRTHARVPYAALPYAASAGQIANLVTYFGGGT